MTELFITMTCKTDQNHWILVELYEFFEFFWKSRENMRRIYCQMKLGISDYTIYIKHFWTFWANTNKKKIMYPKYTIVQVGFFTTKTSTAAVSNIEQNGFQSSMNFFFFFYEHLNGKKQLWIYVRVSPIEM